MSSSLIQNCPPGPKLNKLRDSLQQRMGWILDKEGSVLPSSDSVASELLNSVPPREDSLKFQNNKQKEETGQKRQASLEPDLSEVQLKKQRVGLNSTRSSVAKMQKAETGQKRPASPKCSFKRKADSYFLRSEVVKRQKRKAEIKEPDLESEGRSLQPDLEKMIDKVLDNIALEDKDSGSLEKINNVREKIIENYNEKDYFDMKQIVATIEKLKMQLS